MPVEDYSSKSYIKRARLQHEQSFGDEAADPKQVARPTRFRVEARRAQRRQRRSPLRLLLGLVVVLAVVVLALPYAVDLFYAGRVLPRISVQGASVANVERDALRATLASRYEAFLRQPIELTFENQHWQPTMQQMGIQFDADTAVEDVLAAGRRGDPISRLRELYALWRGGMDVAPFDRTLCRRPHLQRRSARRGRRPRKLGLAAAPPLSGG